MRSAGFRISPTIIVTGIVTTLLALAIINRVPALRNLVGGSPTQ